MIVLRIHWSINVNDFYTNADQLQNKLDELRALSVILDAIFILAQKF